MAYTETYGRFFLKAVEKFIENIMAYIELWVGEEFSTFPSGDIVWVTVPST